jgi:riboflavin kinase/FMN adenylyltransferase
VKIHHELAPRGELPPLALAIGFFDGLHRGHRALIDALKPYAQKNTRLAALTFRHHPLRFLRADEAPALIVTLEERMNLLAAAGIQEVYVLDFTQEIAALEAQQFLEHVLIEKLNVRAVAVGDSFRFGAKRKGDVALASQVLKQHNVAFHAVDHIVYGNDRISSTRVRTAITDGRIDEVDAMLGYSYAISGLVQMGAGRGHDLGFPTANIEVCSELALPADGVYSTNACFDGIDYRALVSIGTNPTFAGTARTVEVWIRDFAKTIYGRELRIEHLRFLRGQKKFSNIAELESQMQQDAVMLR